jgi:hypothetical protein
MDHDDDVEHLFSWLQTPELRYREFAGAREITDTVVIAQVRPNPADIPVPPPGNTQLQEEYPPDQFPDQRDAPEDVVVRAPDRIPPSAEAVAVIPVMQNPGPVAPPPVPPMPRAPAADAPAPFALGAEGRGALRRPQYEEPVAPPRVETPAARPLASPPPPPPPPAAVSVAAPPPPTTPRPAPAGGGLLGGAYREEGLNGNGTDPVAPDQAAAAPRTEHSLDAVFGRLAGGRRPVDPRERLRHIPGLGPPPNRSR